MISPFTLAWPIGLTPGCQGASSLLLPFGAIIGVVELADVVTRSRSRWFSGDYGFVLRNPRPLSRPIPCKGRLSLWNLTSAQERRVHRPVAWRDCPMKELPNNEMKRTSQGPNGGSPLISVFARPDVTQAGPRLIARDRRMG